MATDSTKASRILAEECKAAGVPAMTLHDATDHIFAELDTRCLDDIPTGRLVALRTAGLVLRELARQQRDRTEMPLIECPKCGNTEEFYGYLTVSVNIDREDGRYVATWNEGTDFEGGCAKCGATLDGELSDQLYTDMDIDL